jgi:hypothetical protein
MGRPRLISATAAVIGAAFFLLVFHGWWLDGFALGMAGMLIGQYAGFRAAPYFAKGSDRPLILAHIGIGAMVAVWLCLSEDSVALLGYVAKAFDGAALGYLVVEGMRIKSQIWAARQNRQSTDSETCGQNE